VVADDDRGDGLVAVGVPAHELAGALVLPDVVLPLDYAGAT
jgi:hypothetical protein